jgi:hypothetical protein
LENADIETVEELEVVREVVRHHHDDGENAEHVEFGGTILHVFMIARKWVWPHVARTSGPGGAIFREAFLSLIFVWR